MNTLFSLTSAQLKRAAALKDQITALESKLAAILGTPTTSAAAPKRKYKKMSAAARAKIGAAQTARWAKIKAAKAAFTKKAGGKK